MNNKEKISGKFKKLRVDRVNNWVPRLKENQYDYLFPIEREFLIRIKDTLTAKNKEFFTPLIYTYDMDKYYHIYISYLIESLDVLPLKVDLSFDFSWKGLELYMGQAYLKHKGQSTSNVTDLIKYANKHYWKSLLNKNSTLKNQFKNLIKLIPSQSYEYLGKRALENYSPLNPKANALYTRIALTNGNKELVIDNLLQHLYYKYGNPSTAEITRKVGRIFYKLLFGDTINLPDINDSNREISFFLSFDQKMDLVINGLLYTFRNERFHGNTFSPFKSSQASLKTYSHAHYMFLWTYFLVNLTKLYLRNTSINIKEIIDNNNLNISAFKDLYGIHLKK